MEVGCSRLALVVVDCITKLFFMSILTDVVGRNVRGSISSKDYKPDESTFA